MTSTGVTKGRERGGIYTRSKGVENASDRKSLLLFPAVAHSACHADWQSKLSTYSGGSLTLVSIFFWMFVLFSQLAFLNYWSIRWNKQKTSTGCFFFSDIVLVKPGIHLNAIFLPLNMALMEISRSRFIFFLLSLL